jgi:uroporphyrinogen-III synthase
VPILARGPKPVAALKEVGLQPAITAPEPNTWKEVLAVLDSNIRLTGKRIAVQEYGITNQELLSGLEARGAEVLRVPVYRWALPENIAPLQAAIREIVEAQVDVVIFTSATQVENVFQVAHGWIGQEAAAIFSSIYTSFHRRSAASARSFGIEPDFEQHIPMGFMIGNCGSARSS